MVIHSWSKQRDSKARRSTLYERVLKTTGVDLNERRCASIFAEITKSHHDPTCRRGSISTQAAVLNDTSSSSSRSTIRDPSTLPIRRCFNFLSSVRRSLAARGMEISLRDPGPTFLFTNRAKSYSLASESEQASSKSGSTRDPQAVWVVFASTCSIPFGSRVPCGCKDSLSFRSEGQRGGSSGIV